ncbi:hypothetical protein CIPAW_04G014700 [Carya illinoinensis]|uniref:Uncharacterized protein n=1 Tax=Carya illinoinensis TaxID=32201 RepID=A0A8T1QPG5_CARIL|nr:hypothetical protein CIPAW_04G014700 [Carya illinoinensis]
MQGRSSLRRRLEFARDDFALKSQRGAHKRGAQREKEEHRRKEHERENHEREGHEERKAVSVEELQIKNRDVAPRLGSPHHVCGVENLSRMLNRVSLPEKGDIRCWA